MLIKCILSLSALISLMGCTATGVKINNEASSSVVKNDKQSVLNGEKSAKLFSAIDYLEKEISNSPQGFFYSTKKENLPISAKGDFLAMIKDEKNRFSEFPSGVYVKITRALQDGYINAPCNRNGSINLRCIDFSRLLFLKKQAQMSFDIAQEASQLNITYLPLAEHYKKGLVVNKNLTLAYDNYIKDGALRDPQSRNNDILKMLNSELHQFDSKVKLGSIINDQTCKTFRALTSATYCGYSDLEKMIGSLSIEKIISNSIPLSQSDLKGDWIADTPLSISGTTIKGFDFGKEGVMYASIKNDVRNSPSSFNYKIVDNKLEFDITFSAAGISVGSKLTFDAWKTKNGALIIKGNDGYAVYKESK